MAIDAVLKKQFNDQIADEKHHIRELEKELAALRTAMKQNAVLAPFYHLANAANYLKQIEIRLKMSELSERMMNTKNHSYLDEARKILYKVFGELEKVVTMNLDESPDFNREMLDLIYPFTPLQRLNLFKHIKRSIERLILAYGDNTKWKWSFPELWQKLAVSGKNIIDYRELQSIRDPREKYFYARRDLLELVKESLFDASNKYRDKFELSTKSPPDLLVAIRLLEDLRRIAQVTGDTELVKKAKAGIDSYKSRIETDDKKKTK